jgi:hypothetical protein
MAKISMLILLCLGISMAVVNTKTVKLSWAMPKPTQPSSLPLKQASVDPETLKELMEFQEIVTEGVPLLLKLFNRLMKNKFAKPLLEVLLTCDKQNFMVSCVQGIFQKVVGILTEQQNQAQPTAGRVKKSHDHLQLHMKENQAQQRSKIDDSASGEAKNVQRSDDVEARATGDGDTNIEDHESESSGEESKQNKRTHPVKSQHPHTPLGPTSANHKSEL